MTSLDAYLPYDGPLIELRLLPQQVIAVCRGLGAKGAPLGCQIWGNGGCLIVVPKHDDGTIRNHELAHCNGWKHS